MINIFIVVASVVVSVLVFLSVGYLVVLYAHPDERDFKNSLVYKLFVVSAADQVAGFTLGVLQVLLIPLDVENARSDFGFDMYYLWSVSLYTNAVFMVLLIPFLLFFYETDNEANVVASAHQVTRIADSLCSYLLFIGVFVSAFFIAHLTANSYKLTGTLEVLDLKFAVKSELPLNSLQTILATGVDSASTPPGLASFNSLWNPFSKLLVSPVDAEVRFVRVDGRRAGRGVDGGDHLFRGLRAAEHLRGQRPDHAAVQPDRPVVGAAQEDDSSRPGEPEDRHEAQAEEDDRPGQRPAEYSRLTQRRR